MRPFDELDKHAVTALRVLAIDQTEAAASGHPGMPLGAAAVAYTLWSRHLRFDPERPDWPNRDRFVLSAGHASALLYGLLHLFGYDLPLEELRRFRQWGSRTPGHPEHGLTPGVEMTSGPLGQGLGAAVGMAIAERHMAARFNREGFPVFDHRTFVLASDGDLMEGISLEAASLAGHLRLGRLVVLWDDNRITIEGATSLATSEDVGARFAACGWRALHVEDGNDLAEVAHALDEAVASDEAPTLIRVRTHIGYGSPNKQDTAGVHGSPLGPEEAAATRQALGWPEGRPFQVPGEIYDHCRSVVAAGRAARESWDTLMTRYAVEHKQANGELQRRLSGELPHGWAAALPEPTAGETVATRKSSGAVLNTLAAALPELIGGSADLSPSNNSHLKDETDLEAGSYAGRNLHFGIREHGMGAIANGMALYGGLRPYAATFLVFSDYMRPAIRLAALMGLPVIYIFTHDSVAVGEDGPTHQPVEHLAALRAIPNLLVLRPADAHETAEAWQMALERQDGPTALLLSRQKLPTLAPPPRDAVRRGGYLREMAGSGAPDVVLMASGSEVSLALAVSDRLEGDGIASRVVSVPSVELFAQQPDEYQRRVLGPQHALRVALEAGRGQSWHPWVADGELVTIERFGASAPGAEALRNLGFDEETVAARVRDALAVRHPASPAVTVPASLVGVVEGRRARLRTLHVCQRLRIRDSSLWGERFAAKVARRLGWLDVGERTRGELPGLARLVAGLEADGARTLYLLGMGGSSLAPQVMHEINGAPSGRKLVVVDTTDPAKVGEILDACNPDTAAVLSISKSGSTVETSALTEIFWEHLEQDLRSRTGDRFVAVTEHGTPLERLAYDRRFRRLVPHPVDVGGRFAALSVLGLFPALWLGHDAEQLLDSARRGVTDLSSEHPGIVLGLLLGSVTSEGWGTLCLCASPGLAPIGVWAEQLVAESTGKEGKGLLPVVTSSPPHGDAAWPNTLYLSPRFAGEQVGELDATLDALANAGCPVARWQLPVGGLGEAFTVLEVATAVAGLILAVNPFDEPDVVRAKERTRAALSEGLPEETPVPDDAAGAILTHLDGLRRGEAGVILAYLPETEEVASALAEVAARLSTRFGVPVTAAFGPRYLHSTGQLHKGGPDKIRPLVLTSTPGRDVSIPGQRFTLGQLRHAQALGDSQALADVGRKVLHLHLGEEPLQVLESLLAQL